MDNIMAAQRVAMTKRETMRRSDSPTSQCEQCAKAAEHKGKGDEFGKGGKESTVTGGCVGTSVRRTHCFDVSDELAARECSPLMKVTSTSWTRKNVKREGSHLTLEY